jgi:hypothetical protein
MATRKQIAKAIKTSLKDDLWNKYAPDFLGEILEAGKIPEFDGYEDEFYDVVADIEKLIFKA